MKNTYGSVTKTQSNKWKATATLGYNEEGNQVRKSKTFAQRKQAQKWLDEMRLRYDSCADFSQLEMTFHQLSEKWLEQKRLDVKPSTLNKYIANTAILTDNIKLTKKVVDLRANDFQAIFDSMAEHGRSARYIADIRAAAKCIMSIAEDNDLIAKNFISRTKVPSSATVTEEKEPFTSREMDLIKEYILKFTFGDAIYIMLNTGLRCQELCALSENSLVKNDDGYLLHIDHAMSRAANNIWQLSKTKTKNSVRTIPVGEDVARRIKQRLLRIPVRHNAKGERLTRYIYETKSGTIIEYSNFLKYYNRAFGQLNEYLIQQGIEPVTVRPPHCCRHTFATFLVKNNVAPAATQYLMGHAKYTTTMDIYTKLNEIDTRQELINKMLL